MTDDLRDDAPELEGGSAVSDAPSEPPLYDRLHDDGDVVPADNALPEDLDDLTVEQLRGVLRRRGETTTGDKEELIERLAASLRERPPAI